MERKIRIQVGDIEWEKAEVEGNCKCPDCGSVMVVISRDTWGYAFCPKCESYWRSGK